MPKQSNTRKVSLPQLGRSAVVSPKSLNKEERTVDVIWTTGARVLRRGFFEDFQEELGLEKKNVRMERLKSGTAPVLDNHGNTDRRGIKAQLGVIENAVLEAKKEGRATLRFSKRADVDEVFQDIEDGILRNVSVGYNIFRAEQVGEDENGLPILRAVDWEPVEISMVPAGADAKAQVRSQDEVLTDCEVIRTEIEESTKEEPTTEAQRNEPKVDETKLNPENKLETENTGERNMPTKEQIEEQKKKDLELRAAAKLEEKNRQTEIRSIVSKVGLELRFADEYIEQDKSVDEVRTLVIDAIAEKDKAPESNTRSNNSNITVGEDLARSGRIEGMTSALLHKFRPQNETKRENGQNIVLRGFELTESGRDYAYLSLIDMARTCLEAQGVRTAGLPKHKLAEMAINNIRSGMHSSSDFPEILANVANKTLRNGYLAAPQTFMPFTTETFVSDFKEISRTNLGDAPELLKVPEGGEIKRGSMSENAEKYFIEEYARIVAITRKTIINDDMGAFTRVPERMGRRVGDLESDVVWNVVKANANMSDGQALFSAAHKNLASTAVGAPSEASFSEMREKMRRQVGLDNAKISLRPTMLFVPPSLETATEKQVAATNPNQPSEVNPFGPQGRTSLQFDVEPRLEDGVGGSLTSWYGIADKGQIDMVELAKLEGTDGPQVQTRDGFDINGVEIKIMHDVAAKAIDFRGLYKNAGA